MVEAGVTAAPIHYDSARLSVAATAALVAEARADAIMYRQVLSDLAHARAWLETMRSS